MVLPDVPYAWKEAGHQEYGTRFMKGKPHIRPAFDEQKGKFKSDLGKLVR